MYTCKAISLQKNTLALQTAFLLLTSVLKNIESKLNDLR